MSGMFALALLASTASVFASDIPVTRLKATEHINQVKMKSDSTDSIVDTKDKNGKDVETKDDIKKTRSIKHKKAVKTHKVKIVAPVTKPVQ